MSGMMTKVWGGSTWMSLHMMTFSYPITPSEDDKKHYMNFFNLLSYTLPCSLCRDSYKVFIKESDTLIDNAFESRDTLTRWLYDIHNKVNKKLNLTYGTTYEEVKTRYSTFYAQCKSSCIDPRDRKAQSHIQAIHIESPVIDLDLESVRIARDKKLITSNIQLFIDKLNKYNNSISILKVKDYDAWVCRNMECRKIIKTMRIKKIGMANDDGSLTKFELMLRCYRSSYFNM